MSKIIVRMPMSRVRFMAIVLCLAGLTAWALPISDYVSESERRDMAYAEPSQSIKSSIPPIDAEAPARTETATFALG
jgi:hypothetical protein